MKFRRLMVVLAVICLFCVAITANASEVTASGTDGGNLSWTLTSDGVFTISGEGEMHSRAQYEWEDYAQDVVEVVVEEGVTSLCNRAFSGFTNLVSVDLPGSLSTTGEETFFGCTALQNVTLREGTTRIEIDCFTNCTSLKHITIPAGMKIISECAFFGCTSLETIVFEGDAPYGMWAAFESLKATAYYDADNDTWTADAVQDCGGDITWVGIVATGTDGGNLEWMLTNDGVFTISGEGEMVAGAYSPWYKYDSYVTSVVVGEGITSVSESAFYKFDNLTEVSLPSTLKAIERSAFSACAKLEKINFPESLEQIGIYAFWGCEQLHEVYIPASVTSIGYGAFRGCSSLPAIRVAEGNANYCADENGVLYSEDMTTLMQCPAGFTGSSYAVPEGVTVIEGCAFEYCDSLVEISLPEGITKLAGRVFGGCSKLETINLPGSLRSTGDLTFESCTALRNVTIGYGVQYIGANCFWNCTSLEQIVLPGDIDTIFEWAFDGCDALKTIVFTGSAPGCMEVAFSGVTATVYYPANNPTWTEDIRRDYDGDITWVAYSDTGACGDGLIWILDPDGKLIISGSGEMWDFSSQGATAAPWSHCMVGVETVVVNDGVTGIGDYAFYGCRDLAEITLPGSLTDIGAHAFDGCSDLPEIVLSEGVSTIGAYAFNGCSALEEMYIPAGVTAIGEYVFYGCVSLEGIQVDAQNTAYSSDAYGVLFNKEKTSLILAPRWISGSYAVPASVTEIGDSAFFACENLTEIVLPEGMTTIGERAFSRCYFITEMTLPESVTVIGQEAFWGCESLKEVAIKGNVAELPEYAFAMCLSLQKVKLPDSLTGVGEGVFSGCSDFEMYFTGNAPSFAEYAFYEVTATAYYPAGNATWTSDVMQDYEGDIQWIPYGLFDLAGANMSLGNDLTMNLYVNASDVAEGDYYMEIVKTYADGRADAVKTVPMSDWSTYSTMYYVSFDGVAAKEMTDEFYVTVYRADGTQASNTKMISIEAYAIGMLSRTDANSAATHNLMADMLNYGAAAQQSFKYAQNKLANANMTAEHKACGTQNFSMDLFSNNTVKGTGLVGANLSLESSICMYLYFDQNIVDNTMTASVSYTDHNGKKVSYEIPGSEFTVLAGYGFYGVEITTLAAADAESMVTVEILDGSKVVASGSTSVESLAFNGYAATPLYVDLMKFCTAAYNFFH